MAQFNTLQDELEDLAPELSNGENDEAENQEVGEVEETEEQEVQEEVAEEHEDSEGEFEESDDTSDDVSDDTSDEPEVEDVETLEESAELSPVEDPVIAELRQQNAKLMEMFQGIQDAKKPEIETKEEDAVPASIQDLFSEVSFDDVMSDQELFITFMQKAMHMAAEQSVERVATNIPQYVINQVEQRNLLTEASQNFYTKHQSLKQHKKIVGMLTNEVIADHQDWGLDQVLDETAERSYKLLNLKKEAIRNAAPTKPKGRPALNTSLRGRGNKPAPKLSKLQTEINDLI